MNISYVGKDNTYELTVDVLRYYPEEKGEIYRLPEHCSESFEEYIDYNVTEMSYDVGNCRTVVMGKNVDLPDDINTDVLHKMILERYKNEQ